MKIAVLIVGAALFVSGIALYIASKDPAGLVPEGIGGFMLGAALYDFMNRR